MPMQVNGWCINISCMRWEKKRQSFWAYHLHEHHAVCISHSMLDPGYRKLTLTTWNTQSKELLVLAGFVLLHAPIFLIFPLFTSVVYASLALYYYKHRKAHLDPVWARRHLRWHYEHHLGGNICRIGVSLGHGLIT